MSPNAMLSRRVSTIGISVFLVFLLALFLAPVPVAAAATQLTCGYNVSASVVGGHGSVSPTKQKVERRHTALIRIYPDAGYHIGSIADNGKQKPVANPYEIQSVREKHDVYVTFATDTFKVTASVNGGHGSVNPPTQDIVNHGTASIDLTPETGYKIASITDNGAQMPIDDPYVINDVTTNHSVVIAFTNLLTVDASVVGGHGTVSPPSQTVTAGGTAAVNIAPATGYEIASISDNGVVVPTSNPYVITGVATDHQVEVSFGIKQFTVTAAAAGGHGTVTPASQTIEYGGTASIDLVPDAGYHVATISDTGVAKPISDPYVIDNVSSDHNVVVTFALDLYSVAASVDGGHGTVTPVSPTVGFGDTATINIVADPGYHVATITDNEVSEPVASPYLIPNVHADHTVVVTFAAADFMVAATAAGGHGTVSPTTQSVTLHGNAQPIVITPAPGYHIATVTDNTAPQATTSPYQVSNVTTDHAVVATFVANLFQVTAAVDGPGGSVDPVSQNVALNGTAVINIHPAAGFHLQEVIDNGQFAPLASPYVITAVHEKHAVTVVFDKNEYTVNATVAGGHGTAAPPTQTVTYGGSATIDLTADPGFHLTTLVDNGTSVDPTDPYVISDVSENHDVVATFTTDQYSVFASVEGGHGSISPDVQTVAAGGTAAMDIVADTGYHVENIDDNGQFVPIANPLILTGISTDHDVVVTFAINVYTAKAAVAGGNGAVDPREQNVIYGDPTVIDLIPDDGYHPGAIIDNEEHKQITNPYFIPDTSEDHNVTVAFAYDQSSTFYLAEGSTDHGFSCYISIENPNAEPLNANLTYMLDDGTTKTQGVGLPALSQVTVNPADTVGADDFSTQVTCVQGKTIAVDRTMTWTGPGAPSPEAHSSVGVSSPETTWFLPEGCSGFGFETWTLVENPNNSDAVLSMTYMIEGQGPKTINRRVPPHSRSTFSMEADIGKQNASIEVGSDIPVIAERAMYRNNRREGSDSIGTNIPGSTFYLAEGSTAWGFTTYVLVQNPNETPADVTLTCMTNNGPKALAPFTMAPGTRSTVLMNNLIPNTDFSTMVTANVPIIAERAMYWGAGTPLGEACHDSIGLDEPHNTFYLPDGQTSDGRETYTLVANPNSTAVQVIVSYLMADGTGAGYFLAGIPANSRATFNMGDKIPSGRASIVVTCQTSGKKVLVERSMYWNNRGVGTNTVGDWSH